MRARFISFGLIEIDGTRYEHDVVIEDGRIRKRKKGPSKPFRDAFGHTPLSVHEEIPWTASRLIIGTGASGQLPIMDEVREAARRRGVEITAVQTGEACELISEADMNTVAAVLHVTC